MTAARSAPGGFIRQVRLDPGAGQERYPFSLPAVRWLSQAGGLDIAPGVTFLVGENGTGKSTLLEAVAVAAGLNAEGGSQNFRFVTRASESSLGNHLILTWSAAKPRTRFFLRAESYYNVATEIENLGPWLLPAYRGGRAPPAYDGRSPHERSHGESFLDLVVHRFRPHGLYLLDEPEAALSVRGCLALLRRMADLTDQGSQLLVATHSPILLALPGATILQIEEDGQVGPVDYAQALPVMLTREFLASPERFLRHLLAD